MSKCDLSSAILKHLERETNAHAQRFLRPVDPTSDKNDGSSRFLNGSVEWIENTSEAGNFRARSLNSVLCFGENLFHDSLYFILYRF